MTKQAVICDLRAARKEKGLSQSELAGLAGIKRQAIYDMESGRYVPNTHVALLLAKVLCCRVEDLFSIAFSERAVTLVGEIGASGPRVCLVKVRDLLIAYPHMKEQNIECMVTAPSLIPEKSGDRIKNDRRDARKLARLYRSGELTAVHVPNSEDKAMRDLTRAREDSKNAERKARQHLGAFLLHPSSFFFAGILSYGIDE